MQADSSKRAPIPLVLAAGIASLTTLCALFAVLPQVYRPIIEGSPEDSFIAVESPQSGGTLWLSVSTTSPVDLTSDHPTELKIEVSSDQDVAPWIVFGGKAATSVSACNGTGMFISSDHAAQPWVDVDPSTKALALRYEERRPATGVLYDTDGQDTADEKTALKTLKRLFYRASMVDLVQPDSKKWVYNDEPQVTYPVHTSTLTCSFDASAFVRTSSYETSFAAPALLLGMDNMASQGPMRIDYDFEIQNNAAYNRPVQTFPSSREFVDSTTRSRVVEFQGSWWMRTFADRQAIAISSGTAQFEPQDAATWRVLWRLLAAFIASFAVALGVLAVRKFLYYFM